MGIYDKELYDKLKRFNRFRNKVIHEFFIEIPTRTNFNEYFKLGMELWENTWNLLQHYYKQYFNTLNNLIK
jgi:hypothetical protein